MLPLNMLPHTRERKSQYLQITRLATQQLIHLIQTCQKV